MTRTAIRVNCKCGERNQRRFIQAVQSTDGKVYDEDIISYSDEVLGSACL